jgi:hypothetical protein
MTLYALDGKNDVWIDCEATARLMKSIAFWVHSGFPGSATYMKRSIRELDRTTFWLRQPVQYSNSSRPSAVASASCRDANCNTAVVPAVVSRSCFLTTQKHKSLTFHKHKNKAARKAKLDGISIHLSLI